MPEVLLAGQRVQLVLHVVHKLLQRHQLVGSIELPPGRQRGDDFLTQVSHGRADLEGARRDRLTHLQLWVLQSEPQWKGSLSFRCLACDLMNEWVYFCCCLFIFSFFRLDLAIAQVGLKPLGSSNPLVSVS